MSTGRQLTERQQRILSSLSQEQQALLTLLIQSGLEGDELIGTFLTIKEYSTPEELDSWILWLYEMKPPKKNIQNSLINYCMTIQDRIQERMDKVWKEQGLM